MPNHNGMNRHSLKCVHNQYMHSSSFFDSIQYSIATESETAEKEIEMKQNEQGTRIIDNLFLSQCYDK